MATSEAWPPDYTVVCLKRAERLKAMRENPVLIVGAKLYYKENPIAFIQDWVNTYDPRNASQKDALAKIPFILF